MKIVFLILILIFASIFCSYCILEIGDFQMSTSWNVRTIETGVVGDLISWRSNSVTGSDGYRYIVTVDTDTTKNAITIWKSANPNTSEDAWTLLASTDGTTTDFDKVDVEIKDDVIYIIAVDTDATPDMWIIIFDLVYDTGGVGTLNEYIVREGAGSTQIGDVSEFSICLDYALPNIIHIAFIDSSADLYYMHIKCNKSSNYYADINTSTTPQHIDADIINLCIVCDINEIVYIFQSKLSVDYIFCLYRNIYDFGVTFEPKMMMEIDDIEAGATHAYETGCLKAIYNIYTDCIEVVVVDKQTWTDGDTYIAKTVWYARLKHSGETDWEQIDSITYNTSTETPDADSLIAIIQLDSSNNLAIFYKVNDVANTKVNVSYLDRDDYYNFFNNWTTPSIVKDYAVDPGDIENICCEDLILSNGNYQQSRFRLNNVYDPGASINMRTLYKK